MPEERRAFRELERLWSEMAAVAERFDREHDDAAKVEIYAMMEEVEAVRRMPCWRTQASRSAAESQQQRAPQGAAAGPPPACPWPGSGVEAA